MAKPKLIICCCGPSVGFLLVQAQFRLYYYYFLVKKNRHAEFLQGAGTWANTNSDFLQLHPQTYQRAPRMQLYTILQNQFSTQSSDPQKLFSNLISVANTSWNQEPYNTIFAPLLRAIQILQNNKNQYRQK